LSKKDFAMRVKICRKESKESHYWLELTEPAAGFDTEKHYLINESVELTKIFGSIVEKTR
ncbi:MAG: four helix bundle protein, partial [Patescibacteria group bacterium]